MDFRKYRIVYTARHHVSALPAAFVSSLDSLNSVGTDATKANSRI